MKPLNKSIQIFSIMAFGLITLTILNPVFGDNCPNTLMKSMLKEPQIKLPEGCNPDKLVMREVNLIHSIIYGDTQKALDAIDNYWLLEAFGRNLVIDKAHVLNFHGEYEVALKLLANLEDKNSQYYNAAMESHIGLSDYVLANKYFHQIKPEELMPENRSNYEISKYDLLLHEQKFQQVLSTADEYVSQIFDEFHGLPGQDALIVAYFLIAYKKQHQSNEDCKAIEKSIITYLDSYFSSNSRMHLKVKAILDKCY
jgi:hypothetical protein